MKELIGHSANVALLETNKCRLVASIEVVLLVSEPNYQADPSGFVKVHSIEDLRFATGVGGLRTLIKELGELADEAEELEERASLKPKIDDAA